MMFLQGVQNVVLLLRASLISFLNYSQVSGQRREDNYSGPMVHDTLVWF